MAPRTLEECKYIADRVFALASSIPLTLLVVPHYHGDTTLPADYLDWIAGRLHKGDELALHGYTHLDEAPDSGRWTER
ncbi:MAG TPA: DUF2334 domain-containing protein, partial [Burkholderiales bacterium]|nr:DUF2334 domain-containing protein [Burkholderiales bacterium]